MWSSSSSLWIWIHDVIEIVHFSFSSPILLLLLRECSYVWMAILLFYMWTFDSIIIKAVIIIIIIIQNVPSSVLLTTLVYIGRFAADLSCVFFVPLSLCRLYLWWHCLGKQVSMRCLPRLIISQSPCTTLECMKDGSIFSSNFHYVQSKQINLVISRGLFLVQTIFSSVDAQNFSYKPGLENEDPN